jgi:hypothetical protein
MKKLFTNLLPGVLIFCSTSATPATCIGLIKITASKTYVSASYANDVVAVVENEIHPLDILFFKFK